MFNPFKKPFEINDFAKLVMTEAKKAGIAEPLEYDPKRFVLLRGDQRTYLVNVFNDYCQANEQTEKLIKLYQQKGKDFLVGSYTLNQRETGGYESHSVWSKTIPTLLPKTDLIAFFDPTKPESQRKLGLAKWDDVKRIAGGLMLDTQMFPARFYVSKFPTDEQLAAVIQEQRL
jgi:hypothetical protein